MIISSQRTPNVPIWIQVCADKRQTRLAACQLCILKAAQEMCSGTEKRQRKKGTAPNFPLVAQKSLSLFLWFFFVLLISGVTFFRPVSTAPSGQIGLHFSA
jgi:hypothetical protein